jgi:hypothetical protein
MRPLTKGCLSKNATAAARRLSGHRRALIACLITAVNMRCKLALPGTAQEELRFLRLLHSTLAAASPAQQTLPAVNSISISGDALRQARSAARRAEEGRAENRSPTK